MKQRIVGSKLRNKVSDLKGLLKCQEEQIDLLFTIWNRLTNSYEDFAIMWSLVVVSYEFAESSARLSNSLGQLAEEVPDDAKRKTKICLFQQKMLKKECNDIRKKLKPARNKVGAHLPTDKDGSFITWKELSKIYGSMHKRKVKKYWSTNKNYFSLLKELVDDLEKEGYVAPSPQPKRTGATLEELE